MKPAVDLRSKVLYGLVAAFLITAVLAGLIGLILVSRAVGEAGFVIYLILMILTTAVCLEHSLKEGLSEVSRVWYGIVGGMTAWTVLELGEILGWAEIEGPNGIHLFILVGVAVWLVWKYLPLGARFWLFIFFLNWGGHMVIKLQEYLSQFSEIFQTTLTVYSWSALPIALLTLYWIFTQSSTRIQRLYAAGWLYLFLFTFVHMIFFH